MNDYIFSHYFDFIEIDQQECLDEKEENFTKLLAAITDMSLQEVYIFDTKLLNFLYINKSAEENLGYSLEEMKQYTPLDICTKVSADTLHRLLLPLLNSHNKFIKLQTLLQRKDFRSYHAEIVIKKISVRSFEYFVAIVTDITEQIKVQKQLKEMATTDCLTGAFNRHKANQVIDEEITRQKRYQNSFALLMIDIDYFKSINDKYGHDIGDVVLKELCDVIMNTIRKSDRFARWGGEEFMLLLPQTNRIEALEFSKKLNKTIDKYTFKYVSNITVSIGVSVYKQGDTKIQLLKRADEALYKAKDSGRNTVVCKD